MNQDKLNHLIQEASGLSNTEKMILIKSITDKHDKRPLTDKEKQYIEESEKHLNELSKINETLDKVFQKYE